MTVEIYSYVVDEWNGEDHVYTNVPIFKCLVMWIANLKAVCNLEISNLNFTTL